MNLFQNVTITKHILFIFLCMMSLQINTSENFKKPISYDSKKLNPIEIDFNSDDEKEFASILNIVEDAIKNPITPDEEEVIEKPTENFERPINSDKDINFYQNIVENDKVIWNKARTAWATIFTNGTVETDGCGDEGGYLTFGARKALQNVKEIHSTLYAFAALRYDGTVFTWGHKEYGGRSPGKLTNVKNIEANDGAFVAVLEDGRVFVWGNRDYGGTLYPEYYQILQCNVEIVIPEKYGFTAFCKDGQDIYWGYD